MIKYTVLDLIEQLQGIVNSNPEIDFSEVGVFLGGNGDYPCGHATLTWYNLNGHNYNCVDLE